jgi:hypothetical protein
MGISQDELVNAPYSLQADGLLSLISGNQL